MTDEQLTLALLKSKAPGNFIIVDDEVHHRYNEIVFEFLEYSTHLTIKNNDKIVYETSIQSRLQNGDTLSLKAKGTFKLDIDI